MCVKTTKNYFAAYTRQKQPTFHLLSALSPKIIIDLGGQNWLQSENIKKRQKSWLKEQGCHLASKRQASCKQASYKHAKERARMTIYKQASSKQEKEQNDITQSPRALLRQISKQAAEHTKRGKQLLSKSKMESEWRSLRKRREYLSIRCKHYGLK